MKSHTCQYIDNDIFSLHVLQLIYIHHNNIRRRNTKMLIHALKLPVLKIFPSPVCMCTVSSQILSTQYSEGFYIAGTEGNTMRLYEFATCSFNMSVKCKSNWFQYKCPKTIRNIPPPKKKYTLSVVCGGFTNMSGNICINWAEHFILHTF